MRNRAWFDERAEALDLANTNVLVHLMDSYAYRLRPRVDPAIRRAQFKRQGEPAWPGLVPTPLTRDDCGWLKALAMSHDEPDPDGLVGAVLWKVAAERAWFNRDDARDRAGNLVYSMAEIRAHLGTLVT